jgi:hypothetical protein
MATPFQDLWPRHAAPYPAFSIAALGNSASAALSSCRHTASGTAAPSHASRFGSRFLMSLTLKVAIFMSGSAVAAPQGNRYPAD